tara:strand:- start:74 stop:460 length:387 start_codon:yes stop_codon:yes gene_type:complete
VKAKSAGKNNARASDQLHGLTTRQIRVAVAAIDFYARYGAAPPIKFLSAAAYASWRQIIYRDIKKLIEAGVLTQDKRFGVRTLRPTPAYRLPFADEVVLDEGVRGKLVGKLKQQLKRTEDYHHVQSSQ